MIERNNCELLLDLKMPGMIFVYIRFAQAAYRFPFNPMDNNLMLFHSYGDVQSLNDRFHVLAKKFDSRCQLCPGSFQPQKRLQLD